MYLKELIMGNKYNARGQMLIRLGPDYNIETQVYDEAYYLKHYSEYLSNTNICREMVAMMYEHQFKKTIYTLFEGNEFLRMVKEGCITDDDGQVADVFVDGYVCNLGLATDNLTSGGFLVSEKVWFDICKSCKVEVNWANK